MNKYLAIIDRKTYLLAIICIVMTYVCDYLDFTYDLNITMFSIAIIFPLVFTMRESFKRRDSALKFLSRFKASMQALNQVFSRASKLSQPLKSEAVAMLSGLSDAFLESLKKDDLQTERTVEYLTTINNFIRANKDHLSFNNSIKILRIVENLQESIENTYSLKIHGTPISLRAYCLVFIFLFPLVFTPTILYSIGDSHLYTAYLLSFLHGFVLISLYNVQEQMEDPFDQIGLDDIHLWEYQFTPGEELPGAVTLGETAP